MKTLRILVPAILAATALLGITSSPASAAGTPTDPPPEVAAWFADDALAFLLANAESASDVAAPDFSAALTIGRPFEVFGWSAEFVSGAKTSTPLRQFDVWIAAINGPDGAIGTITAQWRPGDERATFQSYDNYAELGAALQGLTAGVVVSDPSIDSWIVLDGHQVAALNHNATIQLPYPATLDDYQKVVAEQYAQAQESSAGIEDPVGGGGALDRRPWWYDANPILVSLGLVLLVVGVISIAWGLRVRKRRS